MPKHNVKRRIYNISGSRAVTMPKNVCEDLDIQPGDSMWLEFDSDGSGGRFTIERTDREEEE